MPVPLYATYAFQDITATISGPGGNFAMSTSGDVHYTISGAETAAAEEAVTITWGEEANTQTIGADGSVMNSMHSSRAGTVVFRLMKTSPNNARLQQMFHYQHESSARWGINTITIENPARGDKYTLLGCAWVRIPTNTYAKVGNVLEYELHVAVIDSQLGDGSQLNYRAPDNIRITPTPAL
jgi:hypothetical protein